MATMNDQDPKRKRAAFTAFEKAKATHLSRQLHLRLQYAKLKVEHGWQRQTLNEVENLYFRHSRRPTDPASPPPDVTTPVDEEPPKKTPSPVIPTSQPLPMFPAQPQPLARRPATNNNPSNLTYDSFWSSHSSSSQQYRTRTVGESASPNQSQSPLPAQPFQYSGYEPSDLTFTARVDSLAGPVPVAARR